MLTTDAEVSVLGSMLIDERCVPALMQQLTPEDFTGATARHVFEAIRSLFLARRPIDPVLVLEELDGGPAYAQTLAGRYTYSRVRWGQVYKMRKYKPLGLHL